MNQNIDQGEFSRTKQNSVDILFRGLKRKVSQRSYSKIKNSYKKKVVQNVQQPMPLVNNLVNRPKLKLSVISNRITDPQQAHDQLLKLKQANHKLFEQNTELLRKIRKQQKIEQIYRKKLQGRQLIELDYFRAMEIKLLLQVQLLQNELQEKQNVYQQKVNYIKTKKHSFKDDLIKNKVQMYELLVENNEDVNKILSQKKNQLKQKQANLQDLNEKLSRTKFVRHEKSEVLNQIKNQIKQLKEKFKLVEAQSKRDKNSSQLVNITSLMSSLMTNSQKPSTKQASSTILKNNVSSISVKNRNNIDQLQKQIVKIKEQYQMINGQIQEFMDNKIKQKILIHRQINEIEEKQRKQRQIQNRNLICNSGIGKNNGPISLSRVQKSTNSLKCSIVMG